MGGQGKCDHAYAFSFAQSTYGRINIYYRVVVPGGPIWLSTLLYEFDRPEMSFIVMHTHTLVVWKITKTSMCGKILFVVKSYRR